MPTPEARKSRKRLQWIVGICGGIAALALILAGLSLKQSRDVGRSSRSVLCQEEQKTRGQLRFLYTDIRDQTYKALTPKQRKAAIADSKRKDPVTRAGHTLAFVRAHLDPLERLDCGQIIKKGQTP